MPGDSSGELEADVQAWSCMMCGNALDRTQREWDTEVIRGRKGKKGWRIDQKRGLSITV